MGRKVISIWLSLIMMVSFVLIVDVTTDFTLNVGGNTLYVNTTGTGGAYTKIQDAINDSKDGDTVFVYSGIYYENFRVNKTVNLTGENRDTTIINGTAGGEVILVMSDWVNVTGFMVMSNWSGGGLKIWKPQNCLIENNIIKFNSIGIFIYESYNNIIKNNIVSNNSNYGIATDGKNIIKNNTFLNNKIGIAPDRDDIVLNNTSSGNSMYGIYLDHTQSATIIGNYIFNNTEMGIRLFDARYNVIYENNFSENNVDVRCESNSDNNTFYHNNFLGNDIHAIDSKTNLWNDSYLSGGNFWSDYVGFDNFRGPNQDIPGSDGIGDTPYVIDVNSQDNYPLMEPYQAVPENSIILLEGWNLISLPIIQNEKNLNKVLEMIDSNYDAVQWYDITDTNDPWKHNKISKPFGNDLFELKEIMGFWIHITQPGTTIFLYNGTKPTSNQTITLHPGWNMVGYPSLTSYNRTEGLNNLTFAQKVDLIQWYDASTKSWHNLEENDYFEPGRGYWIHASDNIIWDVPL